MRIDIVKAAEILKERDNILILTHENPDGDAIGCAYGLCHALHSIGKNAKVLCADKIPHMYEFIPKMVKTQEFEEEFIVSVDLADEKLLGDEEFTSRFQNRINLCIDHHGSNKVAAPYVCIEENEAAACAETLLLILQEMGIVLDEIMATCIFIGITTDTGCFRYANTTSRSLRMAADMMDLGTDAACINKLTFETRTKTYTALEGLAMASLKMFHSGKCAVFLITQDMYKQSGSDESETHPLTAIPRQIEGVYVGATIKECRDGLTYKISVRTNYPADASAICAKMGGGGHRRAAGCSLQCGIDEVYETLVKHIGDELREKKV